MKKYLILFITLCFSSVLFAQAPTTTYEDYFRYIDQNVEMTFRNVSIEILDMTEAEIIAFDPVFRKYMDEKEAFFEKKINLLEDFRDEMAEDDSRKNQEEDRADFIEDYWEIEIDEMKLRNNYFDILEDKIAVSKARRFFIWEKAVEEQMVRNVVNSIIPSLNYFSTKYELADNTAMTELAKEKNDILYSADMDAEKDYLRYIDAKLEMEFRNKTIKTLNLSKEEIIAFDPVFRNYMIAKEALLKERIDLLEDFRDEMMEDDSPKNQEEDRADFIEDYWEIEVDEMKLKKNYFDILEDKIPVRKAAQFFLWEEAVEQDIARSLFIDILPDIIIVQKIPVRDWTKRKVTSTGTNANDEVNMEVKKVPNATIKFSAKTISHIDSFNNWVAKNKGKVDLSHEYTSNGLTVLVNTLDAINQDMNNKMPDFAAKKSMILSNAKTITVDWRSTDHADLTKEAFIAIAEIMNNLDPAKAKKNKLMDIANSINQDKLMTKQATKIYKYFDAASSQLNHLQQKLDEANISAFNK